MSVSDTHPSNSKFQKEIEQEVVETFRCKRDLKNLASEDAHFIKIKGLGIQPDGILIDKNRHIYVVEVFAHLGELKAGQKKKIATDVLKLAFLKRSYPDFFVYMVFVDEQCHQAASVGWAHQAALIFGVNLVSVNLSDETTNKLKQAQDGQSRAQKTKGLEV